MNPASPAAHLRTLTLDDAPALLRFELENRAWFEQHVEARDASFYDLNGVRAHIQQLLDLHAAGSAHPLLLTDPAGAILGRVNLKSFDRDRCSAELGYRLGQAHVGQGLASRALAALCELAREHWRLQWIEALVRDGNIASARVLLKNGFVRAKRHTDMAQVQGRAYDGWRYVRDLTITGDVMATPATGRVQVQLP